MLNKILVVALVAFTSSLNASRPAPVSNEMESPSFMLALKVFQTGPNTAEAHWDSSNDGPYTVLLEDLQTNQVIANFVTYDNFATFNNLVANQKYQLTVGDGNNQLQQIFSVQ
jgi:hypothetical protein